MCNFHYSFIKKNFDADVLFTDTDSLVYEFKSLFVYEEFFKHKLLFDFGEYQSSCLIQLTKRLLAK